MFVKVSNSQAGEIQPLFGRSEFGFRSRLIAFHLSVLFSLCNRMQSYEPLQKSNNSESTSETQINLNVLPKQPTFSVSSTELKRKLCNGHTFDPSDELKLCDSLKALLSQNAINENSLRKSTSKVPSPKVSVPLKLLTVDELEKFATGAAENLDAVWSAT